MALVTFNALVTFGCGTPARGGNTRSGSENLVEDGLSLVLVRLLCKRELGDEDLTGLGQHALLPSGEATVLVTTPQVTNNLGDLDDVARRKLLEVGLVAPRPVGRLFGVCCAQHIEDALQPLWANDIADTHEVTVLGGNLDGQIALGNLEYEIDLVFALEGASLHLFDQCRTMVRIHDRFADFESHMLSTPFATLRIPRHNDIAESTIRRFCRSEP